MRRKRPAILNVAIVSDVKRSNFKLERFQTKALYLN